MIADVYKGYSTRRRDPTVSLRGVRILMTADTVGGVWHYSLELARELAAEGVEVLLATMGKPLSADQWQQVRRIPGLRLFESDYRLEWMDDPWDDVSAAGRWLLRLARETDPDLIHLNNYAHGDLPWERPLLVVGHSCVVSWWQAVHGRSPPTAFDRYQRAVRDGLRAADWVAAPSLAMRNALQTYYGPLPRTRVIHNGRRATDYRPGRKQPQILTAGRLWDAAKNVHTVASAATGLEWPLYVAGETRHPDGGEVHLDHVGFLGRLPASQLRDHYSESAVYAFPARYEPFGLTILEAALSGCALILGDIPSLRELWDGAALFVPPEDIEAVRMELSRLIGDTALRERLQAAARRRATRYGLDKSVAAYAELYRQMLGAGPAAATWQLQPGIR